MNSKMIAIAAVAVLIASGAALVLAPSDVEAVDNYDSPESLGTVVLYDKAADGDSVTATLKFNEGAYKQYHQYGFTITAGDSEPGAGTAYSEIVYKKDAANTTPASVGGLEITATGDDGEYTLTIGDTDSTKAGSNTIYFKLDVSVTPAEGTSSIDLDPFYYVLKVDVRKSGSLSFNTSSFEFEQNAAVDQTLTVSSPESFNVTGYEWYAIGLPAGLNIGVIGDVLKITGMATSSMVSIENNVKIVGRDKTNGSEYYGTISVGVTSVTEISATMALYSGESEINEKATVNGIVNYVVKVGTDDIQLRITSEDSISSTDFNVSVIDGTGVRVPISADLDTTNYDIPASGVGIYTIEVNTAGSTTIIVLHVVPDVTGSDAGFVIVGSP